MDVTVREARPDDWQECGRICYEAFATLAARHGFPPDFPTVAAAAEPIRWLINHPRIYGVVAEGDGRILGSNFLDERSTISGSADQRRSGRAGPRRGARPDDRRPRSGRRAARARRPARPDRLPQSVAEPLREARIRRARLVCRDAREALGITMPGYAVRAATTADESACNALCVRVHGHDRPARSARRSRPATPGWWSDSADHRLHDRHHVLHPLRRGDHGRPGGAHRRGDRLRDPRLPGPSRRRGPLPLEPGPRPARLLRREHDDDRDLPGAAGAFMPSVGY